MSDSGKVLPPLHPIEIHIHIGAEDMQYVALVLQELYDRAKNSVLNNCCSGGGRGSYSTTIARRDVTPEQFRDELMRWKERNDV